MHNRQNSQISNKAVEINVTVKLRPDTLIDDLIVRDSTHSTYGHHQEQKLEKVNLRGLNGHLVLFEVPWCGPSMALGDMTNKLS